MTDIHELTQKTANHLAGRPVTIRWSNPPSKTAAGQTVKIAGKLIIYVGNLNDLQSRFKVYLHELAHCRMDADWIPERIERDPGLRVVRIKSDKERKRWRSHWREERAQEQTDQWLQYAEKHAPDYWRVGRDATTCKLLALLDWSE